MSAGRFYSLLILLALAAAIIVLRVADLTIIKRDFLLRQSDARIRRVVTIPAHRGMIVDRNNKPLAISTRVFAVWANPKEFHAEPKQLSELSALLGVSENTLRRRTADDSHTFVYLKRGVSPKTLEKIKAFKLAGLFWQPEYKRFYSEGEVVSHVVGFTNIDGAGQEGLELAYDNWLRGVPGKKEVIKDNVGHIVAELNSLQEPREGHHLRLTLDSRIQYIAYSALSQAVAENNAEAGSIVVLDADKGEVLAMANWPSFDPNHITGERDGSMRNRAVIDQFEPGSTIKPFAMAAFLASGKFSPEDKIETAPGWINVGGHVKKDVHNYGELTVEGVLVKSSNVGMSKMALEIEPESLWKMLHNFGFGERTFSGFPGEVQGNLPNYPVWRPVDTTSLAIGYGLSVTTLQLAEAYAVIANGGVKHPVRLIMRDQPLDSERVLSKEISDTVLGMLTDVVEVGTGRKAKVQGYHVAGKTGTARVAIDGGYDKHHYIGTFVGLAPATDPKLVVAVMVKNPQPQHYGGLVAAPAFAKVMAGALRLLAVAPDNLTKST